MGWRDIEAGVNDGSISFAQEPEKESFIQGVGRAVGNYLELNKDEIKAKAKAKADKAEELKTTEAANAKAAKMAKSAMNTYGFDVSDPQAYSSVLSYALLNPDLDNLNTWISTMDFPKVNQTATAPKVKTVPVNGSDDTGAALNAGSSTASGTTSTGYTPINNALVLGESGNNINAIWKNQEGYVFSDTKPVSEMTMKQLLKFVEIDGPYAKWSKTQSTTDQIHTPVGKHQFVGRTLRDIMARADLEELGIDENTKFSEEVQDKLFNWYAKDTVTLAENNAVGEKATTEELRKAFRGRWAAPISDNDMDAIIAKVKNGDYETVEAAVAAEGSGEIDQTAEILGQGPITLNVQEATNNPTYAKVVPDPFEGLDRDELVSIATNSSTPPELAARAKAQITAMDALEEPTGGTKVDPLAGNVTLIEVLGMQTDPKYADDKEFQKRVTARIATLTGNFDVVNMTSDARIAQISIYTQMQARNEKLTAIQLASLQKLQDAQKPTADAAQLETDKVAAETAYNKSPEAFIAEINDINGVRTAEGILASRRLAAGDDEVELAKVESLAALVQQQRVRFSEDVLKADNLALAEKAKAESVETFMTGITGINDVINKEGILDAMQVSIPKGVERTSEEIAQQKKIDTLRDLLAKRRAAFTAQQAIDDEAAIKKNASMKSDEVQSLNEGTARVMYMYSEDGTLRSTSTVYAYLDTNGKRVWQDEAFNVVSDADIAKSELFTPSRADTFIKAYNKQVTAAVSSVADATVLTNSLLELKAKATPELLNPIIQSIGNKADFAKSMVDAWNVVTQQFKDANQNADTPIGSEIFENRVINRWNNTALGRLGELNQTQQEFAGQFLRVAYQIAKVRGSVGQALSNKELDSILDSLGKGITDINDFVSLMDDTLKLELETAEIRRKAATKTFMYNQGGLNNKNAITDIVNRTGIGLSIEQNFLNGATDERKAQYQASKANWANSIKKPVTPPPPLVYPKTYTKTMTATMQESLAKLGFTGPEYEIGNEVILYLGTDGTYLPKRGTE